MKTGSQAHSSGLTRPRKTTSVARSLQTNMVTKHAAVRMKLTRIADFMARESEQINTGRLTMSIVRLMSGSVTRKCFWLQISATSCHRTF